MQVGLWIALAGALVGLIGGFALPWVDTDVVRFTDEALSQGIAWWNGILSMVLMAAGLVAAGIALALLSVVVAPFLATLYEQPLLQSIVSVVGLSFLMTGCQNINVVALQKELDFKRVTYLEQAGAVLGFAVSVGLAYWLRSVWALVYAQLAGAAINSALSFIIIPARVRLRFDKAVARELIRYGRFITGLAIVVFLSRELDGAVIGKIVGMEALGFYVAAYSLANIPTTYLSKLVAKVLFPLFSKLQADPEGLRREYQRGIGVVTAVVVPLSVAIVVLAPEIVTTLYTGRWSAAVVPLQVLSVFGCFRALWMLNGYLYNAIGKPHIDFLTNLVRLVVMTMLLVPLTASYGIVGASVAVTIPMVGQFCGGIYLSGRFIGAPVAMALRPLGIAMGQGLVLAAVLVAGKALLPFGSWLGLGCLVTAGGVTVLLLNLGRLRGTLAAFGRGGQRGAGSAPSA
jgi:PST family polysaccharide transporter/lipopolysaccharide exporter